MPKDLVGVKQRLLELTGADADLLGFLRASNTDQGAYYLTLRAWPHPDVDGATTLSIRYAYLTAGSGSDGWTDQGMNIRIEGDPEEFVGLLAQMVAAARPRLSNSDAEPWSGDATAAEGSK